MLSTQLVEANPTLCLVMSGHNFVPSCQVSFHEVDSATSNTSTLEVERLYRGQSEESEHFKQVYIVVSKTPRLFR